ncbi:hypothetical protein ANO14919_057960 [Xylariales sp. No.14919]|nr:hypothetical protein ANO14919_057960 [Xylariales sp. No.14919]
MVALGSIKAIYVTTRIDAPTRRRFEQITRPEVAMTMARATFVSIQPPRSYSTIEHL